MPPVDDEFYLDLILRRLATCRTYQPHFGSGARSAGVALREFQTIYSQDPFYRWFGLNHPLVYAAHRAAGGITAIYRQIGIGSEALFRQILRDTLALTAEEVTWRYEVVSSSGQRQVLALDAHILLAAVRAADQQAQLAAWIQQAAQRLDLNPAIAAVLKGIVFEVRQGYKSKDSKRQNADIANASAAYAQGYLPVIALLSNQMDITLVERYERARWLVLRGVDSTDPLTSTYAFMRAVIGYDLAAFFERQQQRLQQAMHITLQALLTPQPDDSEAP